MRHAPTFVIPPNKTLLCSPLNPLRLSSHDSDSVNSLLSFLDPANVAPLFQPFDGCDLVLRATKSRPHTDFYVDRRTVYARSPYLQRKISEFGPIPVGIEVVSWEDDTRTLDAMLRFVYPDRPKPEVQNVAHLRSLLKAARKYDIEAARHALGTAVLLDFAKREPLCAFAIACEFGLVDEASLISKDTLSVDIMMSDKSVELGRVSLVSFWTIHYHRRMLNVIIPELLPPSSSVA
jgi:hypothetical protein